MIQRKRKRRQENEIPMDVVEEILTKLPAKSLMRFKCVSKRWSSFISSPYFSNCCLTIPSRQSHRVYICLQDSTNYRNAVTLSLAPDATSSSCYVVNNDLTVPRIGCCILQNLCNFFFCYTFNRKARIYNPTTRQLVTLPKPAAIKTRKIMPGECSKTVYYYFGYDPVIDQYKVLCSIGRVFLDPSEQIKSEFWLFVLKARGRRVWKKLAHTPVDFLPHIPSRGVCIDGVIYYLGWTNKYYPTLLISFNITSEDFKMIRLPMRDHGDDPALHMPLSQRTKNMSLIECSGKVTIIDQTNLKKNNMMDLWSLEDVRNKKWCRKTLVLQSSQQHLVNNNTIFNVRGTTQDGKVFLIPNDLFYPFHILSYDLGSNDIRKIDIEGVPDHWFRKEKSTINLTVMDLNESFMYLET